MTKYPMQYPFEGKIFQWVNNFSEKMTGHCTNKFLILLNHDGMVEKILFFLPKGPYARTWENIGDAAEAVHDASILYDPYDFPESAFVKWENVSQHTMERLMGEKFDSNDFISAENEKAINYPVTWKMGR